MEKQNVNNKIRRNVFYAMVYLIIASLTTIAALALNLF